MKIEYFEDALNDDELGKRLIILKVINYGYI